MRHDLFACSLHANKSDHRREANGKEERQYYNGNR